MPGRHVDDEHVEFAPGDFAQHLQQRRLDHRPAPDHRDLLVDEESHRHDLQAVVFHRPDHPAFDLLRTAGNLQQPRHRGAIDIGIENADAQTVGLQRQSQIDRGRRLADAALAGSNSDDRTDARNAGLCRTCGALAGRSAACACPAWECPACGRCCGGPLYRRSGCRRLLVGGQRHHGALDAGNLLDHPLGSGAQGIEFARAFGRYGDREIDLGIGNEDIGDQAHIDDVAVHVRPAHAFQLFEDLFLGDVCHVIHSRRPAWPDCLLRVFNRLA